ncbi:MAG: apolipoprotein N-acyltransferase [Candidatus Aceula lacicola]|nr:apolipoprotein N-acyltransferase [Candidatus Aceula lacicola]
MINNFLLKRSLINKMVLYFSSALLLVLSFPSMEFSFLVWIALVPLMLVLDGKSLKESFKIGYFTGIIFFGFTIHWLFLVTTLGAVLSIAYLALYFALFSIGYFYFSKQSLKLKIILIPCLWVVLEFVRGHLIGEFGWVFLAHTQYKNLILIQIADITGAYGVSFLIVAVNVLLKEYIFAQIAKRKFWKDKEIVIVSLLTFVLIGAICFYGLYKIKQPLPKRCSTKIAVVQGNVSLEKNWHPDAWPLILRDYFDLTEQAVKDEPDLVIWPESAFPGYHWEKPVLFNKLKSFVKKINKPFLIGIVDKREDRYYNSAFLFSARGDVQKVYDKLRLVLFGEYIPLRNIFPWLVNIVPIDDFTRGKKYITFPVGPLEIDCADKRFSTLICFEDTIPEVVRGFVKAGAGFLISLSNDAWFGDTKEPFLHLQNAVFRSIENRRYLVRCGNVGVSCFIDALGRIFSTAADAQGKKVYFKGHLTDRAFVIVQDSPKRNLSVYTKFGDVFTYLCFGGILMGTIAFVRKK